MGEKKTKPDESNLYAIKYKTEATKSILSLASFCVEV